MSLYSRCHCDQRKFSFLTVATSDFFGRLHWYRYWYRLTNPLFIFVTITGRYRRWLLDIDKASERFTRCQEVRSRRLSDSRMSNNFTAAPYLCLYVMVPVITCMGQFPCFVCPVVLPHSYCHAKRNGETIPPSTFAGTRDIFLGHFN